MRPGTVVRMRVLLLQGVLTCALSLPMHAQGTVSGSVHLLERGTKSAKDIDDAVVFLDADGGSVRPGNVVEGAVVNMKGREFAPHVQIVRVGGTVA